MFSDPTSGTIGRVAYLTHTKPIQFSTFLDLGEKAFFGTRYRTIDEPLKPLTTTKALEATASAQADPSILNVMGYRYGEEQLDPNLKTVAQTLWHKRGILDDPDFIPTEIMLSKSEREMFAAYKLRLRLQNTPLLGVDDLTRQHVVSSTKIKEITDELSALGVQKVKVSEDLDLAKLARTVSVQAAEAEGTPSGALVEKIMERYNRLFISQTKKEGKTILNLEREIKSLRRDFNNTEGNISQIEMDLRSAKIDQQQVGYLATYEGVASKEMVEQFGVINIIKKTKNQAASYQILFRPSKWKIQPISLSRPHGGYQMKKGSDGRMYNVMEEIGDPDGVPKFHPKIAKDGYQKERIVDPDATIEDWVAGKQAKTQRILNTERTQEFDRISARVKNFAASLAVSKKKANRLERQINKNEAKLNKTMKAVQEGNPASIQMTMLHQIDNWKADKSSINPFGREWKYDKDGKKLYTQGEVTDAHLLSGRSDAFIARYTKNKQQQINDIINADIAKALKNPWGYGAVSGAVKQGKYQSKYGNNPILKNIDPFGVVSTFAKKRLGNKFNMILPKGLDEFTEADAEAVFKKIFPAKEDVEALEVFLIKKQYQYIDEKKIIDASVAKWSYTLSDLKKGLGKQRTKTGKSDLAVRISNAEKELASFTKQADDVTLKMAWVDKQFGNAGFMKSKVIDVDNYTENVSKIARDLQTIKFAETAAAEPPEDPPGTRFSPIGF